MARLQKMGHKPIAVLGGATGMIGDPSGKSKERVLLTEDVIQHNVDCIKKQIGLLLDYDNGAKVVNNMDWFEVTNSSLSCEMLENSLQSNGNDEQGVCSKTFNL